MAVDPTRLEPSGDGDAAHHPEPGRPRVSEPSTLARSREDTLRAAGTAGNRPSLAADCWFLTGPTASGKSAIAVELALRLEAEIVSVDSMAVYRGLDVGTAKPTPEDRGRVRHHLVDVVTPAESYSVARWLDDVAIALADCRGRGRRILFVGGTPLYLRALRDGLAPLPAADPEVRRELLAEITAHGPAALHARLAAVDPVAATRIHPHDAKRIIRGLEVVHATGRPLSAAQVPQPHPVFETQLLIRDMPRRLLAERIDRRVERMFAEGLVEETEAALRKPGGIGPTARQAAGYAEAIDLLAGSIGRSEAIRRTQQRTRQLAKRQLTWLRSFRDAVWVTG
jgi:tRNA dimethylallyltransferase